VLAAICGFLNHYFCSHLSMSTSDVYMYLVAPFESVVDDARVINPSNHEWTQRLDSWKVSWKFLDSRAGA
jgi:hypothetical protein